MGKARSWQLCLQKGLKLKTVKRQKCWLVEGAVEFAIDVGFLELVIEGDNVVVMTSLSHGGPNMSQLGHVVHDIQWLATGLRWASFSHVRRSANSVAHVLARHAKNVVEDMIWLEETPPPAVEALYFDVLHLSE